MISSGVSRASRVKSPATESNSRKRASAASWADPTPPAGCAAQAVGRPRRSRHASEFHAAQHLSPGPVRRGAVTPPAHAPQHARAAVGSATRHFREHRGLADTWLAGDQEQLTCARQHLVEGGLGDTKHRLTTDEPTAAFHDGHCGVLQARSSSTRFNGASTGTRRTRVKPAARATSRKRASPAWVPNGSGAPGACWDRAFGVHTSVEIE